MITERPDLTERTALSKSALAVFSLCQTKAWYETHERRRMLPSEKVSFGSALDGAIEAVVTGARDGWDALTVATAANRIIEEVSVRDDIELAIPELTRAWQGFRETIIPTREWSDAVTQASLWGDVPGLGEVNGHPDIIVGGEVWDVKSSSRAKGLPSIELGFYAILTESATGEPVRQAGYYTWVRSSRPHWEVQPMTVTDEIRRWTWENARRLVAVRELPPETQAAIAAGPSFAGLCRDCTYAPWNGGGCAIALNEGDPQ